MILLLENAITFIVEKCRLLSVDYTSNQPAHVLELSALTISLSQRGNLLESPKARQNHTKIVAAPHVGGLRPQVHR